MSDVEKLFTQLRRGPWHNDPMGVPQEGFGGNGNIESQGWISDNAITADTIQANAVTAGKIDADAVTAREILANTITASEIAANTITGNEIAANAITGNHIAANTITASDIAANTITASEIAANTLTANEIAANAITASELAADSVITSKILAGNVVSSKIELVLDGKQLGAVDGSGSQPGVYWDLESTTGIWRDGAGLLRVSVLGNQRLTFGAGNTIAQQTFRPSADNIMDCGTSSNRWATVYSAGGVVTTSDARKKKDIADLPVGLDFIRSLRPRVYRWKDTPDTQARESVTHDQAALDRECKPHESRIRSIRVDQLAGKISDQDAATKIAEARAKLDEIRARHLAPVEEAQHKRRPGRRLHAGLIAQELKESLDAAGIDLAVWQENPEGEQSLRYDELIPVLIRGMQELASENAELAARIAALERA